MKMFGKTGSMTFPMSYDYQGEYYDFARKGWKGLSSLEKSLSVALGIVSTVSVALMIAVIVVGVQRNQDCDPTLTTRPSSSKTTTPRQPATSTSNYCDTPIPERPPRKKSLTLRKSNGSSDAKFPTQKSPFMPISTAECISLHEKNSSVCLTSECFSKAAELMESLDTTANPCENFYQFACGNWDKNHQKPEYMLSWNQFDVERRKRLYKVKGLLEKDHSLLDSRSFRLAKQFYHSCMHPPDDEVGVAEIRLLAEDLTTFDETSTMKSLSELLGKQRRFSDTNSIISLYVELSDKNISEKSIYIGKPLGMTTLASKIQLFELSQDKGQEGGKVSSRKALRDFIGKLWSLVFPTDKENLDDVVNDVIEFGRKLSEISNSSRGDEEDLDDLYPSELDEVNLSPTMRSFVQDFVGNVINEAGVNDNGTEKITILINDLEYFAGLENVINTTSTAAIVNYLRLELLLNYGPRAGKVFRKLFREFEETIVKAELLPTPRWITCVRESNEFFGLSLAFVGISPLEMIHMRDQLNQTVIRLKEVFNESIQESSWIPKGEVRQFLQQKIELMKTHIGFPDYWLNEVQLDSNESSFVDNFYAELDFTDPTNYFQNYIKAMMWLTLSNLNRTKGPTSWPTWQYLTNTQSVYFQNLNELAVPLGMIDKSSISLNPVFPSLRYSSGGIQIAREMMQAVIGTVESRGANSMLTRRGDNETLANYQNVSDCFKNEVNAIGYEKDYQLEESEEIFQEAILYSGALSVAFKAYQSQLSDDETFDDNMLLPGFQDYSPEQLFFLTYAQTMCSSSFNQISSSSHNWRETRDVSQILLDITLRNSVDFANHWTCSLPEETCKVI